MSQITVLSVTNMKCGGCVSSVRKALEAVPGVESAEVDLDGASATVSGKVETSALISAVQAAGFGAELK